MTLKRRLILITAVITLATPAVAYGEGPSWTDAGANLPTTVNLEAVGTCPASSCGSEVVVVAGQDTSQGQAVIYRYASGSWLKDTISSLPADSCLKSVAIDGQAAWAVGSQAGGCPGDPNGSGQPLLVRLPAAGTALTGSNPASWNVVSPPSSMTGTATSVALSSASGLVGDSAGGLYSFTDPSQQDPQLSSVTFTPVSPQQPQQPSAIAGVAMWDASDGYAVGDWPTGSGSDDRIFQISATANTVAPFDPTVQAPVVAVAALGTKDAIAIDGVTGSAPGWWATDQNTGVWEHYTGGSAFTSATLSGVSLAPDSTAVISGWNPSGGTIWQRPAGQSSFTAITVSCQHLNGVSAAAPDDIWAVGSQGTVLHYSSLGGSAASCDPSTSGTTSGGTGSVGSSGSAGDTGSGSGSNSGGSGSTSGGTGSGSGSGSSGSGTSGSNGGPQVTVSQPPSSGPKSSKSRRRHHHTKPAPVLVHDVRVRVERGQLLVACTLSGPARISALAIRAGHVIGQAGWHSFTGRRCQFTVPYSGGRPPSNLRIIARPLSHLAAVRSRSKVAAR